MATKVSLSDSFPSAPYSFVYDASKPTYYSEYYAWCLHKHQAALAAAGASTEIDETDSIQNVANISAYADVS